MITVITCTYVSMLYRHPSSEEAASEREHGVGSYCGGAQGTTGRVEGTAFSGTLCVNTSMFLCSSCVIIITLL